MDEHTVLSSDPGFGTVSVCPGGVVHINLPHCSLKFLPQDFGKFCELVARARAELGKSRSASSARPRLQLVTTDQDQRPPDSDE